MFAQENTWNKLIYKEYFGVSSVLVIYDFLLLSQYSLLIRTIFLRDTKAVSEAHSSLPGSPRKTFYFSSPDSIPVFEHSLNIYLKLNCN